MAEQTYLFAADTQDLGNGSYKVTPKRLVDNQLISAKKAAAMLKFKDVETIYGLLRTNELDGWKPKSLRGNGKWRVRLGSVIDYEARRVAATRGEIDDF